MAVFKGLFKFEIENKVYKINPSDFNQVEHPLFQDITFDSETQDIYKININPKFFKPEDQVFKKSSDVNILDRIKNLTNSNLKKSIDNLDGKLSKVPRKKKKQSYRSVNTVYIELKTNQKKDFKFYSAHPKDLRTNNDKWILDDIEIESKLNIQMITIKVLMKIKKALLKKKYAIKFNNGTFSLGWFFCKPWVDMMDYSIFFICIISKKIKPKNRYVILEVDVRDKKGRYMKNPSIKKRKIFLESSSINSV
ncbi:hypothetical protein [Aquimarina macrocephali]|uniref:hypothetical protein n=1 Tax=Aquimarina macrocephali TaxID=666563 RepID=UPI000464374E|nr:hypothetical protein [Aquimarina macrocephali]